MTDLLETGMAWLAEMQKAYMSRLVTYSRGMASVELLETAGKSEFEQVEEHGLIVKTEARDFIISVADLVLSGTVTKPQAGDRINAGGQIYEVMAPGDQPVFRYTDAYHNRMRVHTKHVGTE